jgi:ketosteroid isomerase-like protein
MTRTFLILLLSILLHSLGHAQAVPAAEKELREVDAQFVNAVVKNDKATLGRLYADDYYCIHSNGVARTKAEELASTASVSWTGSNTDEIKSRIYGDVGIVTGRLAQTGAAQGFLPGARRYTDIYVKRGGHWQVVGCQSTLVPTK